MNLILNRSIIIKSMIAGIAILSLKNFVFKNLSVYGQDFHDLIELSDITIIFTGAFFVFGLLLAATMSDFKESERIPGEIASNLEAIKDWIYLSFKAPRTGTTDLCKEELNKEYLRNELITITDGIISWIYSKAKDSSVIFPLIRKSNEIAYYFAERGVDKEAIKGIQENTNAMRKQLTRAYSISRNNFVRPAYILLQSILFIVMTLLLITKFKTTAADYFVTSTITFLFCYLYLLIVGLDDPFDISSGEIDVDLKPIDRFRQRLVSDFLV
ncbi:hypothetical protein [Flavobacterium sp.]|uniref:hypothetical protein n=1 Tax=Flavobacterium sp. TaxID=239 RepID=UPI002B4B4615|nr:hypothetical protein [Flavobacterium sp.]HLP64799.1 hypothetical protein [Flavobacterium sp.]